MSVSTIYKSICEQQLAPYLISVGFSERRKYSFFNIKGDTVWRISSHLTDYRGLNRGKILITVGVGFHSVQNVINQSPMTDLHDRDWPTVMATDIGHLMPQHNYNYHEYHFNWDSDGNVLASTIIRDIKQYGLPFFDHYGTLDLCVKAWENGVKYNPGSLFIVYYHAVAYWLRHDKTAALNLLQTELDKWNSKYKQTGAGVHQRACEELASFMAWLPSVKVEGGKDNLQ